MTSETRPQRPAVADRWGSECGSALLLMPAAVLVLIVLGAIAVDFAIIYLGERSLADATAAAANDAASALDEAAFYQQGRLVIQPDRARAVARASFAARRAAELRVTRFEVDVLPPSTVRVTIAAEVPLIFSAALPGAPNVGRVDAATVARAERR